MSTYHVGDCVVLRAKPNPVEKAKAGINMTGKIIEIKTSLNLGEKPYRVSLFDTRDGSLHEPMSLDVHEFDPLSEGQLCFLPKEEQGEARRRLGLPKETGRGDQP